MSPMFLALVRKDLYLYRHLIIMALVVGAVGLALIATGGGKAFFVGSSVSMCSLILLAIFLSQFGVIMERKQQVHHFILSLPVTTQEYVQAKMLAIAIAFFGPWLVISGLALAILAMSAESRGIIPFAITIVLYFPVYFLVMLGTLFERKAEVLAMFVIIFFNIGINFFIPGMLTIPSVGASIAGADMQWVPAVQIVLGIEVSICVIAIAWCMRRLGRVTDLY